MWGFFFFFNEEGVEIVGEERCYLGWVFFFLETHFKFDVISAKKKKKEFFGFDFELMCTYLLICPFSIVYLWNMKIAGSY